MNQVNLLEYGTDLSSRVTGRKIRNLILLQGGPPETVRTTVNCAGVRTMSESFADELFGVLVAQKGKTWFRDHVNIIGLSPGNRMAVLRAIDARLS